MREKTSMRASTFLQEVRKLGIRTIAGIPDSTLKPFCDAVCLDGGRKFQHYVTANEGAAVGLATGIYLAQRRPCLIYLQFGTWKSDQSFGVHCKSGGIWHSNAVCRRLARRAGHTG